MPIDKPQEIRAAKYLQKLVRLACQEELNFLEFRTSKLSIGDERSNRIAMEERESGSSTGGNDPDSPVSSM